MTLDLIAETLVAETVVVEEFPLAGAELGDTKFSAPQVKVTTQEALVTRFLPYTTKSRLPQHPALVRAYLAFPPAWRLLGKQTLYVGERPA